MSNSPGITLLHSVSTATGQYSAAIAKAVVAINGFRWRLWWDAWGTNGWRRATALSSWFPPEYRP